MKIKNIELIGAAILFAAVNAFAASPSYENFNAGDFQRSGNSVRLKQTLTNNITGTAATASGLDATGLGSIDTRRKNSLASGTNNFAGNGAGLTNVGGVAIGATNAVGKTLATTDQIANLTNATLFSSQGTIIQQSGTNSAKFGNTNRGVLATVEIKDGAIWMPESFQTNTANVSAGYINWWGAEYPYPGTDNGSTAADFAKIGALKHWGDGVNYNPWLYLTSLYVRLEEGYANYLGVMDTQIHLGNEDNYGRILINYTQPWSNQVHIPNWSAPSHPLVFATRFNDGAGNHYNGGPAIMGRSPGDYSRPHGPGGGQQYPGWLEFYSLSPIPQSQSLHTAYTNYPGEIQGVMLTNGWAFRGARVEEHKFPNAFLSTNLPIDFTGAEYQTFDLVFTATNLFFTTNTQATFVTSNHSWSVGAEKKIRVRAGALDRYLKWPSGWSVVSQTGQTSLPTWLTNGTQLVATLQAFGVGETNITVARWGIGTDNTFIYDDSASAFFTAASISSSTHKAAVDYLCKALKAENIWTNGVGVYPFVGGASGAHSVNLKTPGTYNITWSGGMTHNANGVTGDGSNYGNTGITPSTHLGNHSVTNFTLAVFCKTTAPTDATDFIGVVTTSPSLSRLGMGRNGASLRTGPAAGSEGDVVNMSTDFTGFIGMSRDGSADASNVVLYQTRLGAASGSVAASSAPTSNLDLFGRNFTGSSVDRLSNANLAFAFVGYGMDAAKLAKFRTIVENFEAILGR